MPAAETSFEAPATPAWEAPAADPAPVAEAAPSEEPPPAWKAAAAGTDPGGTMEMPAYSPAEPPAAASPASAWETPAPPAEPPAPPAAAAWETPAAASEPPPAVWAAPPPPASGPPAAPSWDVPAPAANETVPASGFGEPEGEKGNTMSMPAWAPAEPMAPPAAPPAPPVGAPDLGSGLDRTIFVDSAAVAGAGAAAAAPSLAEGELMIASGPDSGHTYKIDGPAIRIGRAPDNDLVLRDPATSGHHARVERRGNQFFVVDLGSTNGTLVNGEVVMERELKNGDAITIGQNAVNFAVR